MRTHRYGYLQRWSAVLIAAALLLAEAATAENAGKRSLRSIIVGVESAADTPNIDISVTSSVGVCALEHYTRRSEMGETVPASRPKRFHAASISKLFTALIIMQLRDRGSLNLQDLVGDHVPAFSGSPIRLEHLITHTSGLRDRKRANGRNTASQVKVYIRSLAHQKLRNPPGSKWRYADAGFNLLGRVIERATGRPFAEVMQDRLLEPMDMKHSSFDLDHIPLEARVVAYNRRGAPQDHPWDLAFLPSSGLQTTAADLARFAQAILLIASDSGALGVLRPDSLREMTQVRIATKWNGVLQGYGWQLADTSLGQQWRHAGSEAGFESLITLYPERGFGIALLGNQKDWPRFELERAVREAQPCL